MNNFKTITVTEKQLGVNTSFDSILTNIMLLQLQRLKTVGENIFSLLKKVTSSMLVNILIF